VKWKNTQKQLLNNTKKNGMIIREKRVRSWSPKSQRIKKKRSPKEEFAWAGERGDLAGERETEKGGHKKGGISSSGRGDAVHKTDKKCPKKDSKRGQWGGNELGIFFQLSDGNRVK